MQTAADTESISSLVDKRLSDEEIAYCFVRVMESYKFKPLPTPPASMKAYYESSREKKLEVLGNKFFWQRQDVSDFLDQKSRIKNENESNLYWLKWAYENIPDKDIVTREKLKQAIFELEHRIKLN